MGLPICTHECTGYALLLSWVTFALPRKGMRGHLSLHIFLDGQENPFCQLMKGIEQLYINLVGAL